MHVGGGKWIIIDSCVGKGSLDPLPLAYLKDLGVDVSSKVALVIASHWHDDHIRGLGKIVAECTAARFVCAYAMVAEKFRMLGKLYAGSPPSGHSGVNEFAKIHQILNAQNRTVVRTGPNRILIDDSKAMTGLAFDVRVISLSPSDEAAESCVKQLASQLSRRPPIRHLPSRRPNDLSIVVQVLAGNTSFLLGSDMENGAKYGWETVLNDTSKSDLKSCLFKVAHHGSASGHNDRVWSTMLEPKPYALLTPFRNGRHNIPQSADIARIKTFSPRAYSTLPPNATPKRRQLKPSVRRTLRESGITIHPVMTSRGQICFRMTPDNPSSSRVDLYNGAVQL